MPQITLVAKYGINLNAPFSPQDVRDKFLSGIPNDFNGQSISDSTIEFYINSATELIESYLGIKLNRQVITETRDFNKDDWSQWGYLKATYPVQCALAMDGYLGDIVNISYPKEWLSVRKTNDNKTFTREFRLVPNGTPVNFSNSSSILIIGSAYPILSWWRNNGNLPNYWQIKYITGFPGDKIPGDILQAVGMVATISLLGIVSDMYMSRGGLGLGVASKSISLDGLSQSVSSYANGQTSVFGARVKQYSDQLYGANGKPGLLDMLKDAYSSIIFAVC